MMESNFPVDGRSCGFVPLWNALKHIVKGASETEKTALFHGTAARVYRLAALDPWIPRQATYAPEAVPASSCDSTVGRSKKFCLHPTGSRR